MSAVRSDAGERKLRLPFPSLTGEQAVWYLSALLAAVGALAVFLVIEFVPDYKGPFRIPWWILAPMFGVAEVAVAHLQFRKQTVSASVVEVPVILGLFFSTPLDIVAGASIGVLFAFTFIRRQPMVKLCFNLAKHFVEISLGIFMFAVIVRGAAPMDPVGWLGSFGATLSMDIFSGLAVYMAISMVQGKRERISQVLGFGTAATLANTCLALLAATVLWHDVSSGWLLIFPAVLVVITYRAYTNQRDKHLGLEKLFDSARVLQHSVETEAVVDSMLSQARKMLMAEYAEFKRFPAPGRPGLLATQGPGEAGQRLHEADLDPRKGLWARVQETGESFLLRRPIEDPALRAHFEGLGIYDLIVVPLTSTHDGGGVVGQLMVGNRAGDVKTFDHSDVRLLETLATHASVALDKGQLVDSLAKQAAENEYQAQHDALTGLHNRAFFHDRVGDAIDRAGDEGMLAVLLMDLDRFKEINDTLGHHIGDGLLVELASRLSANVAENATVARLGGDEFAVLLPTINAVSDATAAAEKVVESMARPFKLEALTLDVSGSIGIALYPAHGVDADTLMQRADVAMYLAKENHRGYEIYASDRDQYSPSRLALVAELKTAIEQRELEVWYQPKVDLRDGAPLGAEALVRWNHPRNGMMPPDEFISLAEHTGLIGSLTELVLDMAMEQCREWRKVKPDFQVAVNLSVRNLMDAHLAQQVSALLVKWGLPADALQLEITESTIMADPVRAITTLSSLKRMGIRLSIDDFGTGYSSLSYLKRLPVTEIKIDRSFVMGMTTDDNDAVIVRSVVDLGRNLGLAVVAEGIEDPDAWDQLADLGCLIGQGFFISKPLPVPSFSEWMDNQMDEDGTRRPRRADGVIPLMPRRTASSGR